MIDLSLTPLQQETCRNALALADAIALADFLAIKRVNYAPEALSHAFIFETFAERMNAAADTFHSARSAFVENPDESELIASILRKFEPIPLSGLIRLDDRQAHALRASVDLLSRMHLGQFHIALEGRRSDRSESHVIYGSWLHRCNGSFGIHHSSISEEARTAWDIWKAIRHHYAWIQSPRGGPSAAFDRPMAAGREPLPVVHHACGP